MIKLAALALIALASCTHHEESPMTDTLHIRSAIAGVVHDIDAKRWPELRARFADQVDVDYTSLFGGTVQHQTGDALIDGWRGVLARVATQHLLGPIEVEVTGTTATAHCHVRGAHYAAKAASGAYWEVLGHYVFTLTRGPAGWKITAMTLQTQMQLGNPKLLGEA